MAAEPQEIGVSNMSIGVKTSDGYDFDTSFREQLPTLEKTMAAHGLDPSAFTITKGPNDSYSSFQANARYNDYTIDTGEDSFTVSYVSDAGFLEYFLGACISPDDPNPSDDPVKSRSHDQSHSSLIGRLARWIHLRR